MYGYCRCGCSNKVALIARVVVNVRDGTSRRQKVVGIAFLEGFELASHPPVLFDRRLEPLFEVGYTVFVITGRVMP